MNRELRTLADCLIKSANLFPEKIALICDNNTFTYKELYDASQKIATVLKSNDIKRGDRVVIFMDNTLECAAALWGTILAEAVFVIINPQTKIEKLAYMLLDSDTTGLITEFKYAHIYLEALIRTPAVKLIISTKQSSELSSCNQITFQDIFQNITPQFQTTCTISVDLAALIYTSGSTGDPKGVMMTHQSMVFTLGSLTEYLQITPDDRIINVLPLAFDYGLYQFLLCIYTGATLVLEHSFTYPANTIAAIQKHHITIFPGVPTIFVMLLNLHKSNPVQFDSVRTVTNTAAALPPALVHQLEDMFPNARIFRMYGLTECKRVSYLPPEFNTLKPESVGKAIPGTEVFVLDENKKPVRPGERGILYIRGAHVMMGYWKKPELTNYMISTGTSHADRVLCSQDYFTIDDEGYLYFLGRSDDIIKTQGQKVSPVEIENCLYSCKSVIDAAVIGFPDDLQGESIYAFVYLEKNSLLTEAQIRKYCRERLENFMVPKVIKILPEELPKTANGKILKRALKEQFLSK
jgi:long-chain acyl-CoA synthetase